MSAATASETYPKNVLCRYFKLGVCRNGANCGYSHDPTMNSSVPCKYFQRGTCAFGRNCRFDHVKPGSASNSGDGASSGHPNAIPALLRKSWAEAPEFVPSSAKSSVAVPGKSYAQAAGAKSNLIDPSGGPDGKGTTGIELCPFGIAGECRYGAACVYVHGIICDLCGDPCLHPYNEVQRKEHRKECLMRHEEDMKHSFELARSIDKQCGICYDTIMEKSGKKGEQRFGILPSCNHVFCLTCIRTWRGQKENVSTKSARACPQCRVPSDFVIPSKTWVEDKEEKDELIKSYKGNMNRKACKFFNFGEGECPFGNKCFYRHETRDGRKVDVGPPKRKQRTRVNADGEVDILQSMLMWDFIDSADMHDSFMLEMAFLDSDEDDEDFDETWDHDSLSDVLYYGDHGFD